MALYFMLWMLSAVTWMLAYGLGYFRLRAITSLSSGTVFVFGSLFLVERFGLLALPMAGVTAMLIDFGIAMYALPIWQSGNTPKKVNRC